MNIGLILPGLLFLGCLFLLVSAVLMLVAQVKNRRKRLQLRYEDTGAATAPPAGPPSRGRPRSLRREVIVAPWAPWGEDNSLHAMYWRLRLWWLALNPQEVLLFVLCWLVAGLLCVVLLGLGIVLSAGIAFAVTVLIWVLIYRHRRKKRLERIVADVPEALDIIVRSLRVGNPFSRALLLVSESMDGPIAEEFGKTVQEISYGHDQTIALHELAERCDNQDLRFLATAVAIQQGSGGNLAEVLQRLAAICRGRQQLALKVQSLTSEARWSGKLLSVFPIIAALGIFLLSPNYFDEVAGTRIFVPLLIVVGVLLVANVIFMRRMLIFED